MFAGYSVAMNNDRLSDWFAGAVLSWLAMFVLVGLPVFHLWLRVQIPKVAMFAGICCALQLCVTPWLFHARATRENPSGRVVQRALALTLFFSSILFLVAYILRLSWRNDLETRRFTEIMIILTVVFAVVFLIRVWLRSSRQKESPSTSK